MTKHALIAVALVALLVPAAVAQAGGRHDRGHRYDRGHDRHDYRRDHGHRHNDRHKSRSSVGLSFGFGSVGHRDYSHFGLSIGKSYGRGHGHHGHHGHGHYRHYRHRPVYVPAPVYVTPPPVVVVPQHRPTVVYTQPPVVYSPPPVIVSPPPTVYYSAPRSYTYRESVNTYPTPGYFARTEVRYHYDD